MSKIRGPYKRTKRNASKRPANYFKPEHEDQGHYISWAGVILRGDHYVYVQYKIHGESKQFRCPRSKTLWLDSQNIDYAKHIVDEWKKANNNSTGVGSLLPDFYMKHRGAFIKWLSSSAEHSTIQGYEDALKMYVFPYIVERLKIKSVQKWDNTVISKWDAFLMKQIENSNSRNRKRTALRRYLKFLKRTNEILIIPQIINESISRNSKEVPLPGDSLPDWKDVLKWLKSLPSGRYRFIRAVTLGFGLRISEALLVDPDDFIGMESLNDLSSRNDFVSKAIDQKAGYLFLNVDKAVKRNISKEITAFIGKEQDLTPKSGSYIACCTNKEMARFIVKMINENENQLDGKPDEMYKTRERLKPDLSGFKFHEYRPHDDRRLNITLQCLDLSLSIQDCVEAVCMFHGQSSRDVFNRYFQWGKTQRRKQKREKGTKLKIISL